MEKKTSTWEIVFWLVTIICVLQYVFMTIPALQRMPDATIAVYIGSLIPNSIIILIFWLIKRKSEKRNNKNLLHNENVANKILTETKAGNELLENLAEQGNKESMYNMGTLHFKKGEYNEAFHWFEKGANNNDIDAQYQLGNLYLQGLGVAQNSAKAFYWYEKAANQDHPESQHNMGLAYLKGIAYPISEEKAKYWLKKAAGNGYNPSADILKDINSQ